MANITKIGICFGGYSPLHQGHLDVIMRAKKECDLSTVIVCGYEGDPRASLISLKKRYNIIRNFLDDDTVKVGCINDTDLGLDESMSNDNWVVWLDEVYRQVCNLHSLPSSCLYPIEFVFYVGESDYVKYINDTIQHTKFAYAVNKAPVSVVYVDRTENIVSGTACRENPLKNWDKIAYPFRTYYSHNILIAGTASEGKSTLCRDIGKYFNLPYSYEKGRDICKYKTDDEFNFGDFMYNLTSQNEYNESLIASPQNPGVFISDTDNMVTLMYAKAYKERKGFAIDNDDYDALYAVAKRYAKNIKWDKIFLLSPHEKGIVDDGERYMPDSDYIIRKNFFDILTSLYNDFGYNYEILSGSYYDNYLTVKQYIKTLYK